MQNGLKSMRSELKTKKRRSEFLIRTKRFVTHTLRYLRDSIRPI